MTFAKSTKKLATASTLFMVATLTGCVTNSPMSFVPDHIRSQLAGDAAKNGHASNNHSQLADPNNAQTITELLRQQNAQNQASYAQSGTNPDAVYANRDTSEAQVFWEQNDPMQTASVRAPKYIQSKRAHQLTPEEMQEPKGNDQNWPDEITNELQQDARDTPSTQFARFMGAKQQQAKLREPYLKETTRSGAIRPQGRGVVVMSEQKNHSVSLSPADILARSKALQAARTEQYQEVPTHNVTPEEDPKTVFERAREHLKSKKPAVKPVIKAAPDVMAQLASLTSEAPKRPSHTLSTMPVIEAYFQYDPYAVSLSPFEKSKIKTVTTIITANEEAMLNIRMGLASIGVLEEQTAMANARLNTLRKSSASLKHAQIRIDPTLAPDTMHISVGGSNLEGAGL